MLKKSKTNPKSPDTLLKTHREKDIELTEKELGKVTGGTVKTVSWAYDDESPGRPPVKAV